MAFAFIDGRIEVKPQEPIPIGPMRFPAPDIGGTMRASVNDGPWFVVSAARLKGGLRIVDARSPARTARRRAAGKQATYDMRGMR